MKMKKIDEKMVFIIDFFKFKSMKSVMNACSSQLTYLYKIFILFLFALNMKKDKSKLIIYHPDIYIFPIGGLIFFKYILFHFYLIVKKIYLRSFFPN